MSRDLLSASADSRRRCLTVALERPGVTIVMGLDRNRGQVIAGWIDTDTGEVSRARVVAVHRRPVERLLGRFWGQELEVALAATVGWGRGGTGVRCLCGVGGQASEGGLAARTGWRLEDEETRAVGGRAERAEPAEPSPRRGPKKRAKSGRADARHLRELLMISRLPESW